MSVVYDKTRNRILYSVHTPDYIDNVRYIINPDITAIKDADPKYWKVAGEELRVMDASEKAVVDAAFEEAKSKGYPCPYGHQALCLYAPEK